METIFAGLLDEVKQAHDKSLIKQYCLKEDLEWHYSLITTTMERGGPLVLGFNWGATQNYKYKPQPSVTKSDFSKEDVDSLSRIFPYCEKYFGKEFLSKTSQSNYCFFRSKNESQISKKDIELCEPIFEKLIDTIQPSSILCFSSKLREYLISNDKIAAHDPKKIKFKRGATDVTYEAIRATLKSGIEIKFLPHPNYPMKRHARDEAWEFCCATH